MTMWVMGFSLSLFQKIVRSAKMTTHGVVILKAAFAACLLRPDPTSVPRDEISAFHICLEHALSHCSPANIQV
jgi:hypothetical protein